MHPAAKWYGLPVTRYSSASGLFTYRPSPRWSSPIEAQAVSSDSAGRASPRARGELVDRGAVGAGQAANRSSS